MEKAQAESALLALRVACNLTKETPWLHAPLEDVLLNDPSFMDAIPIASLDEFRNRPEGGKPPLVMTYIQVQSVLLALEVIREVLRETPWVYRRMKGVMLSDVAYMQSIKTSQLIVLLGEDED